tara:strand:- start:12 stop:749 length:738 start_codon:yes stop_codon:yes gene_type:complete
MLKYKYIKYIMDIKFIEEDIHTSIKNIEDNTFNLIYTSPPYGITEAEWDKPLNWVELFPEMWRVLKPNGIIVLHSSMPFTYELLKYETPKYHYIWKKNKATNFLKAKLQPLRICEEILIYYKIPGTYNPQMIGDTFHKKGYASSSIIKAGLSHQGYYNTKEHRPKKELKDTDGHIGRYPNTFLEYPIRKEKTGINRPDAMIDFFIKTYSNEGDYILDMTCHNDFTSKRCNELKRNFLGIDIKLCF